MVAVIDRENLIVPKGLGHDLLIRWAPWARDDSDNRHSWNVKPRVASAYKGDPPDEYWIVDKIVAPHKRERDDFWRLVSRHYLGEMDFRMIARELKKPEWWCRQVTCWACEIVRREFEDWH